MGSLDDGHHRMSWICSSLTLQSEKEGFFQTFAENVLTVGGSRWLAAFAKRKTDRERILSCLYDHEVRDVVRCTLSNVQTMFRSKSGRFAQSKREEAEHYLAKGKLPQAALCANVSVARAPFPGVEAEVDNGLSLPLCLQTRAKVSLATSDYEATLEDLQLALKHRLPDQFKLESYRTMADCYLKIGDKQKAKISWTIVLKLAELAENDKAKTEALAVLENLDERLAPHQDNKPSKVPDLYEGESRSLPGTSGAISMARSESRGRYMVANGRLPVGATLSFEEPHSSVLKFDKQNNHCLNCFSRLKRVVPCPTCSGIAYCSVSCATTGHTYHRWECPYMELLIGSGMSVSAALSLRMVTQSPVQYFVDLFKALTTDDEHPHLRIYNLATHGNMREPKDFAYRTLMALLQLEILRASGYFGEHGSVGFDKLTPAELSVGCLLLRHLQLTQYNAHEIYESVVKKDDSNWSVNDAKMNYVGLGLYPSSDYFNHQCQPTLARYYVGKTLVLRTERPINKGEEVCENYGPSFLYKSTEERKKVLSARYHFTCDCPPCQENWPTLANIPQAEVWFKCSRDGCGGKFKFAKGQEVNDWSCPVCGEPNNLSSQLALNTAYTNDFTAGLQLLIERKTAEADVVLSKFIEDSSGLVLQPNYYLTVAMEAVRNCWASYANFYVV